MRNKKKNTEGLTVKLPKTSLLKLQLAIFIPCSCAPLAGNIDFGTLHHFTCIDILNHEQSAPARRRSLPPLLRRAGSGQRRGVSVAWLFCSGGAGIDMKQDKCCFLDQSRPPDGRVELENHDMNDDDSF
jgi:hypothetical protein